MAVETSQVPQSEPAREVSGTIPLVDYLVLEPEPHLVARECAACGALYFDRRNGCGSCGGTEFAPRSLATTGEVRAFTVIQRGAPGVPSPYTSVIVDLDEGGVVKANLFGVDNDPNLIRPRMKVKLVTWTAGVDDDGVQAVAFAFEPDTTQRSKAAQ